MSTPPIGFWGRRPIAAFAGVFIILYDQSSQQTLDRALDLAETCEADLEWLEGIFQCNYHSAPYSTVIVIGDGGGAASNNGYDSDASAGMYINASYNPSGLAGAAPEIVRMLFVAEMAEILMDFTGYGWNRASSHGEALSVMLATLRHPVGYYNSNAGPRVNQWLGQNPRSDFLSKNSSDTDAVAYGNAIVELYYLTTQLALPLTNVVRAGGGTAAETFARVTGRPADQAFGDLSALLEKHLPTGSPVQVPQDNFFPLLQENQRSVLLNVRDMAIADIKDPSVRKVHRSAGPNCGAKDYTYFLHNTVTRIDATARGAGFGNASFEWLLNGQLLTKTGAWTDATIEVQLSDSSPDPADRPFTSVLQVRYLITQSWNKSSLSVQNANSPGNCDLSFIAVALEEGIVGEHGAQTKKEHPFVSRWYEMDAAFFNDAYICHPHPILQIVGDTAGVGTQLSILKTLPDPGPDDIRQLGALSASIERTLDTLTSGNRGLRQAILSAARAVAPAHEVVTEELLLASRAEKKSIVGPVRFGGAIPGSPEIPIYDTAADVSLLAAESAALNGGDEWVPPVAVIGG